MLLCIRLQDYTFLREIVEDFSRDGELAPVPRPQRPPPTMGPFGMRGGGGMVGVVAALHLQVQRKHEKRLKEERAREEKRLRGEKRRAEKEQRYFESDHARAGPGGMAFIFDPKLSVMGELTPKTEWVLAKLGEEK